MEFRVLGRLEVVDGRRVVTIASRHQRALLALLLVNAGRPVSTEHILDALWGDTPPESGAGSVAFHVSRLRATLGNGQEEGSGVEGAWGPIVTEPGGYALRVAPDAVDAARFERLAAEGRELLAGDPAAAVARLRDALAMWRGEPFEDVDDNGFLQPEVARLVELRLRTLEDRFDAELALGRGRDIVGELESLVAAEPLREHLRAQLMRALYGAGRQADALRVYRDGHRLLADQLGIDPSPELQALELAVLRQDATLGQAMPAPAPRNPYKGLQPFAEADAADFFGRELHALRLRERLEAVARAGGLLLLVGPSGSGKSSLLRAGLLPLLRSPAVGRLAWRIAVMVPGSRPVEALWRALEEVVVDPVALGPAPEPGPGAGPVAAGVADGLARAAASDPRPLVVVIDQLEEVFALAADRDRPSDFLRGVARAVGGPSPRPVVVASLRADWLDRPLLDSALGNLVRDGVEVVTPLTRDELERAIVRPAAAVGVELEPGLVADLETDLADQPGALPLLQFALTELFEHAGGQRLTRESYAAIGGVAGAVGRRAEAVFGSLDETSRRLARRLFLHLAAVGEGRAVAARRTVVDDLRSLDAAPARVDAVLEAFGRWRLLAFDRDPRSGRATVELAHEALLTHWPRLAGWIQEAEESLWMRARLAATATEWAAAGRDPGFLLAGSRLDLFDSWSATTDIGLDAPERELLEASLAEHRRTEAVEHDRLDQQQRLERRAASRLKALVIVLLIAVLGASGLLAAVWRQAEDAREQQAIAQARALAVASVGRLDSDPSLALLLAVEAARATTDRGWITEEAVDALQWAIQAARIPYPPGAEAFPTAVRLAPDTGNQVLVPHGVYLVPGAELIDLARTGARRSLSDEECRAYLHLESCPPAGPERSDGDLAVLTRDGPVAMSDLAGAATAGASVALVAQLPADLAGAIAGYAEGGDAISVTTGDGSDDPRHAVDHADIAILARPDDVASLARSGTLIPLDRILSPAEVEEARMRPLAELGTVEPAAFLAGDRTVVLGAAPIAATASGVLWYPARAFAAAGYEAPRTWYELERLVGAIIADGRTPWCMGMVGGESDGTNGVDLMEDIVLDQVSASGFNRWAIGARPFATEIGTALRRYHALLHQEGAVLRGPESAVLTPAAWAALQMGTGDVPQCWLIHASADQRVAWVGEVRDDLTPIRLPVGLRGSGDLRGRVYTLLVLRDRPEVRELVRYLLGVGFAGQLVANDLGSGMIPLSAAGTVFERPPTERALAALVSTALATGTFREDASDRMPRELGVATLPASAARIAAMPVDPAGTGMVSELNRLEQVRLEAQR